MSEPYPPELRRVAGDDVDEGAEAPGVPHDPERVAEGGGIGTGDLQPPDDHREQPGPA